MLFNSWSTGKVLTFSCNFCVWSINYHKGDCWCGARSGLSQLSIWPRGGKYIWKNYQDTVVMNHKAREWCFNHYSKLFMQSSSQKFSNAVTKVPFRQTYVGYCIMQPINRWWSKSATLFEFLEFCARRFAIILYFYDFHAPVYQMTHLILTEAQRKSVIECFRINVF